jgi:hypothetical protein
MVTMLYCGEREAPPEILAAPNAWMALCPILDFELIALLKIVRAAMPRIVPLTSEQMRALDVPPLKSNKPDDVAAHERAKANAQRILMPFRVAFTYCHCTGRAEKPDRRYFVGHWAEACEQWAGQYYAPRANCQEFTFCAAVANADIPYGLRTYDWEPALGFVNYNGGRRAGTAAVPNLHGDGIEYIRCEYAWREVLAGTRQLRPSESPAPVDRDPSTISHKHRFDHPRRWGDMEPWDKAT